MSSFCVYIFIGTLVASILACKYFYGRGYKKAREWNRGQPLSFADITEMPLTFKVKIGEWCDSMQLYSTQIKGLGSRLLLYPNEWSPPVCDDVNRYIVIRESDAWVLTDLSAD